MDFKQVILIRADIKMSKGKTAAQCSHASLESALKVLKKDKKLLQSWRREGAKKVVLRVADKKELLDFDKKAKQANLISALITDAGHTELKPGTMTCLGIGPDKEEKIDKITKELQAL